MSHDQNWTDANEENADGFGVNIFDESKAPRLHRNRIHFDLASLAGLKKRNFPLARRKRSWVCNFHDLFRANKNAQDTLVALVSDIITAETGRPRPWKPSLIFDFFVLISRKVNQIQSRTSTKREISSKCERYNIRNLLRIGICSLIQSSTDNSRFLRLVAPCICDFEKRQLQNVS